MEITRLRVSGFKSFSEPAELQLEPGLTGVVGPNGCGKSNIVEALRWAMGESSAKGLRGDEMDDVIFNGSSTRPAHDVAEVRLRLHGRPEGLTGFVEEGELEVARRIGRGVGSSYRINGREARARDIQLLFADAGAGSRSPAIISQGQIGFIVDARPTDRRKLLEDAAGIGGLQSRRREAELRLEATQANLQRVLDLLATQETRLAELAKQGRQAQRYRQLSADLRATEAQLLLGRHVEASRRAAAANERLAVLQGEREAKATEAERRRRVSAEAAARLPSERERSAALQAEASGLQERLSLLRDAAGREAEQLAAVRRQRDEAARDLERADAALVEMRTSLVALAAEAAALSATQEAELGDLAQLEAADEQCAADLLTAQEALRALIGETAEAVARHEAIAARGEALARRRAAIDAELPGLPEPASRSQLAEAARDLATCEARLAAARAELDRAIARAAELAPGVETAQAASLAAEREAASGRERLALAELRQREADAVLARWAERCQTIERARARLSERQAAHARRLERHAAGAAEADAVAREREFETAEQELASADGVLDAAREVLAGAEHARSEAARNARELRRSADALAAEIRVLEGLIPQGADGTLLERLVVPEELGTAIAAALGDDLLVGTDPNADRRWGEPAADLVPSALPDGAQPLATLIGAPTCLDARLARTGLVDAAEAGRLQALLPAGHRLVSPDGGLWRWDGYVQEPGGETQAAAGVRHRLRLHAARDELEALARESAAADSEAAETESAVQAAREALGVSEARWRAADSAQLQARQRMDQVRGLAEQRAAEAGHLAEEEQALLAELAEVERDSVEAAAGSEHAAERDAAATEAATAKAELADLERALVAVQVRVRDVESALAAAAQRRATIEADLERASGEAERCRSTAATLGRAVIEEEADRRARGEALERERDEIVRLAEAAEPELSAAQELRDRLFEQRTTAERASADAEQTRRTAGDLLNERRTECTRLAGRLDAVARARTETDARREDVSARRAELGARAARLVDECARAEAEIRSDPTALAGLERTLMTARADADAARSALNEQERSATRLAEEVTAADADLAELRERVAVAQTERGHAHEALAASVAVVRERLQQEPLALLGDPELRDAVAVADLAVLEDRLLRLRASRERLGAVNLRADVEAGELEATLAETRSREGELQEAVTRLRDGITTLDREARQRLLAAFEAVDGHFQRLFSILFGGGKAQLRLAGDDDPLRAGLELEASPPGKKLSSISLLSGGEKTLTALALVFGFFLSQPSPLCVLDEVDAPLDDANVDRFVGLMHEIAQTTGTRFLVVTHHPLTMARMHRLYGVTMAERGVSRLVSVALEQALELRATA